MSIKQISESEYSVWGSAHMEAYPTTVKRVPSYSPTSDILISWGSGEVRIAHGEVADLMLALDLLSGGAAK